MDGAMFVQKISDAYQEVVHWHRIASCISNLVRLVNTLVNLCRNDHEFSE